MEKPSVVSTRNGKIEGQYQNGIHEFKGIPYAAPPVGKNRWLPPQPAANWNGIRPAKQYGPISPQSVMNLSGPGIPNFAHQPQSEDCLFLNVWTPGLDDNRRPVIFWIHGGAFIMGAGSESFMEGGNLAKRGDIVLVTINYRLGAAGFLNLKEISGGKIPATGNEGMLDQIAALDWVIENISAFGGNPGNITISGFSAGGMSVGTLLAIPLARGKFQKAMNRSGAANIVGDLSGALNISKQFLGLLGLKSQDIDGLYRLTTRQLLEAQQQLSNLLRQNENRATPFQPVVDGSVLPEYPMTALKKGVARDIPILAGNTLDELKSSMAMDPGLRNLDEAGLIARLGHLIPSELVSELIGVYHGALTHRGIQVTPLEILGSLNTDFMFRIPTLRLVEMQRDNGAAAYNYLFTYRSPALGGALGASHGLDNPLLFGVPDAEFTGNNQAVKNLSTRIMDSVAAFAYTGDPSCQSIGRWPAYGSQRLTMLLDLNTRVESAPFEAERRVWEQLEGLSNRPI
jgi:para-nitrobenzyl esterase